MFFVTIMCFFVKARGVRNAGLVRSLMKCMKKHVYFVKSGLDLHGVGIRACRKRRNTC
jgi:hypothetical protein